MSLRKSEQHKKRQSYLKVEGEPMVWESQINFKPSSNHSMNIYEKYKTNLEKLNII